MFVRGKCYPGSLYLVLITISLANDTLAILMVLFEISAVILVSVRHIRTFREQRGQFSNTRLGRGFGHIIFEQGEYSITYVRSIAMVKMTQHVLRNFILLVFFLSSIHWASL